MHRHVIGCWLCWLLASAAVTAAATNPSQMRARTWVAISTLLLSAAVSGPSLAAAAELQAPAQEQADTIIYCNITVPCKPCLPKHLNTQACRPTAHAQHLTCTTEDVLHWVALLLHRRVLPEQLPLHVSQTCDPKQQQGAAGAAQEEVLADALTEHADAPEDASAVANGGNGGAGDQQQQRPVQLHYRFGGGVNLLYFEVFMVLVLAGSVPLMCYRKRRYVRL